MSRKGYCWDNAVVESFFGSLKSERVRWRSYQTREEARVDAQSHGLDSLQGFGFHYVH